MLAGFEAHVFLASLGSNVTLVLEKHLWIILSTPPALLQTCLSHCVLLRCGSSCVWCVWSCASLGIEECTPPPLGVFSFSNVLERPKVLLYRVKIIPEENILLVEPGNKTCARPPPLMNAFRISDRSERRVFESLAGRLWLPRTERIAERCTLHETYRDGVTTVACSASVQ